MERIATSIRRYFQGWSTVDPAVALGLFGTGVGMAIGEFDAIEQGRPMTWTA